MSEARKYQHAELAAGRWHTMSLMEQLGNIGSEVNVLLNGATKIMQCKPIMPWSEPLNY